MSDNLSRSSWKQCALLLILLSHAVFGSPVVPAVGTAYESLEPVSQADISSPKSLHKINQVLDFKTRLVNNLEHQNREQNTQVLGTGDGGTAGSSINTTTEVPTGIEVSTFDPNKVSLNLPGTLFATGFSVVSSTASIIETLVQNTALRIARLFDALKPILLSSSSLKSKKRETNSDFVGFEDSKGASSEVVKEKMKMKKPL